LAGSGVASSVSTACANGVFSAAITFSANDGTKTVTASQTDAAGNTGSDSRNFLKNTTAPSITITSPAANSYVGSTFTVQGACVTGLPVTVAGAGVASAVSVACNNGAYSAGVTTSSGDGTKNVTASQTDAAGNTGTASRDFLRDTTPPALSITSPANGTTAQSGITLVGACETGLTVVISGTGISAGTSVTCANSTYSANLTFSAGDGPKTVNVSETDGAGNTSQVSGTFNRDATPPAVAITSPAANTMAQSGLTVGGTCETGLNVVLSGSGVASNVTTACTNGAFSAAITFSAGDGTKAVTASQTDAVGNTGSDSRNFVKNNVAPAITITSPAANSYVGSTFTVQGACVTGLQVTLSGGGIASAVSAACTNGAYSAGVTTSAGDGTKTVTASQTDSAGNTGTASRNFLRDTTAPVLTISSPANGTTAQSGILITGTCEPGLTVSFSGSGVSSSSSVTCTSNGTYQANLGLSTGDGPKTVNVSETDPAGNNSQVTGNFNRDSTPPAIAITSPTANTPSQTGAIISGTCEAGLSVNIGGSGVATQGSVNCSSQGTFSTTITFTPGDGNKTITASQTDAVGNTGTSSINLVRDNTGPRITISSPAANSYVGATFTVQGSCETGLPVTISGAGISSPVSVACNSGAYSAGVTASSGDGTKNVMAQQTDAAGNISQDSRNFVRDSTAPVVTITSPVANSSVPTSTTIAGACETGLTVVLTGDITSTSGNCVSGAYSVSVTFSAGLGSKTVTVKQTDAAGNVGQASSTFSRDSNGNSETFISSASFGKIDVLFIDDNSGSMDPNQTSLANKFSSFASELMNIDWQIGITTTDCSAGPYGICGSLLPLTGASSKILTPSTPNYQTVFGNSIQRPETKGCLNTGTCPAGNSEPLLSATTAMNKFNTDNNGFFRGNSDLAIVILSDADEGQTGSSTYNNRPSQLIAAFNNNWPSSTGKKLKIYSIIVKPGDTTCFNTMNAGSNGFSFYGALIDQTVNLTSGLSTSICAPDYSVPLKAIGESVRTLTNSVQLAHTPIAGSVTVTFTPNQNIGFKVIGDRVVFDAPPSVGTEIKVDYQY
jgi:hypothetical protein